jgi:hypothetical protein
MQLEQFAEEKCLTLGLKTLLRRNFDGSAICGLAALSCDSRRYLFEGVTSRQSLQD